MNNNNDNITEHFNDEIRKLANSDKEVHKELVETITKFRDEEAQWEFKAIWQTNYFLYFWGRQKIRIFSSAP